MCCGWFTNLLKYFIYIVYVDTSQQMAGLGFLEIL